MIVVCAWCVAADRPGFIREKAPYTDDSISHTICPACRERVLAEDAALLAARKEAAK